MKPWTPNLAESSLSVKTVIFVDSIDEVAHTHAQNAPLEQFLSIPGLGVDHVQAVEQDLLVAYLVINIHGSNK